MWTATCQDEVAKPALAEVGCGILAQIGRATLAAANMRLMAAPIAEVALLLLWPYTDMLSSQCLISVLGRHQFKLNSKRP